MNHHVVRRYSIDPQRAHHGDELTTVLCAMVEAMQVHLPCRLSMCVPFKVRIAQYVAEVPIVRGIEQVTELLGVQGQCIDTDGIFGGPPRG